MCLIFISLNDHPDYTLIVAANRDEFYERKTQPAQFWNDHTNILGGRDLEASGTWMAMAKNGKISMVTNYRDLQNIKKQAPSRGQLVSDYLLNGDQPVGYLRGVENKGKNYNGFNLVVGTPKELYYYSNYRKGIEKIPDGLHGLSNHLLNTSWPKVEWGKEKVKQRLTAKIIDPEALFEALYDDTQAPDALLPDTGVGLDRERMLSSMFIKSPNYGTRCSTVILVNKDGHVHFSERVYDLATFNHTARSYEFKISPS
ncbi:MAG: NRDE family protein [Cyclobacteriaceae bacterium]